MFSDSATPAPAPSARADLPPLPVPTRSRFQPLRMGLVELFHYDVEEFWFRDGHLLLRGNNGTGKSKVLSLTLPFLLDASLSPSRVEPDGDRTKRMEWNLLMGRHERRVGYAWLELGRLTEDASAEYVTLGCGLRAVAGKPRVESWHFITDQRVGDDLSLVTQERIALTKEKLGEALAGRGQLFDTATEYRRAVDQRLFRLGERYDALIDTLIQLRQPQLSKKPDENSLSEALSNAMPELPRTVLEDVAEAMNQLDEYREELAHLDRVREAVSQFGRRYRIYAQIQSRRQARVLRKAQTELDKQSHLVNEARAELERTREAAAQHQARVEQLDAQLRGEREKLDELRADPTMSDARRLSELEVSLKSAAVERDRAQQRLEQARAQLAREAEEHARRERELSAALERKNTTSESCARQARAAGIDAEHASVVGAELNADEAPEARRLERELLSVAERRLAQTAQLRRRLASCEQAERRREQVETRCHAHRELSEKAEREARTTHKELELTCAATLSAWRAYVQGLSVLRVADLATGLSELEAWLESLGFEQPMRPRVDAAQRASEAELAAENQQLKGEHAELEAEDAELSRELEGLLAGAQRTPLPAPLRDAETRAGRAGAPFWQLFEFQEHVAPEARAGLEAALEASGMLDAWVTPEAHVLHPDTHDAWLEPHGSYAASLASWLAPAEAGPVPSARLAALLAGIACGEDDDPAAHTFVGHGGRYRIGSLRGAAQKDEPQFLGQAAREAARQRRVAQISALREALAERRALLEARVTRLDARRERLRSELARAPKDDPVHAAHARHSAQERQRREALEAQASVEAELQLAERVLREASEELTRDARDLKLPATAAELTSIEQALTAYKSEARTLRHALEAAARNRRELAGQREREHAAGERADELAADASARSAAWEDVKARHELLLETAGAAVAELTRKISELSAAVKSSQHALEVERDQLTRAREAAARNEQRVTDGQLVLDERLSQRRQAVERLGGFAATGLLALAVPDLELPAQEGLGVDAALTLARRAEQLLAGVPAEDSDWTRVQNEVSRDYTALGQALSVLGQKAHMEHGDFGLIVQILYRNRPERPDVLERLLMAEVEQRKNILSAREREVLENHLQAEVAASLVRLLRQAEAQVERINAELKRRPTSTGVYFKLDWEPLAEDGEGSPVGLSAARARLLRRVSDAWSAEDRRVIGEFLAARIEAERARDDTGSLVEHLARALDYRAWHRFRVKRWHDGAFRPLSGPASSGERALGLTVPLFAAASSHYASGGSPHAPRLVLLDEAFAGIDDEARAHCMALIREFDLDFVMTSEREWGCYATLPGVSICHILRREGVDAAFVSRWTWDGKARRAEPDPSRRFLQAASEDTRDS